MIVYCDSLFLISLFLQRRRELAKDNSDSEPDDYVPYVSVKDRKKNKVGLMIIIANNLNVKALSLLFF
jgi:hypothetical protein